MSASVIACNAKSDRKVEVDNTHLFFTYTKKAKSDRLQTLMGCLYDPANVSQTFQQINQNTRADAGRLLEVCWKFAGRLLDRVNTPLP